MVWLTLWVVALLFCHKQLRKCEDPKIPRIYWTVAQLGRAHNIGECRWNHEHSYPEKWLIKVLDNEFGMKENIDYRTEMPFGKYALDFAWECKKFAIEIDGEQHERFEIYKERDKKKDELLKENSWSLLRIKWKECFARPKEFIEIIRNKLKELTIIN